MKKYSFDKFMQDQHALQYYGTDDMMPDDYLEWLDSLSTDEWLVFGDKYMKYVIEDQEEHEPTVL